MAQTTGGTAYVQSVTANYTMLNFDALVQVDLTAGNVTITLPNATKVAGIPFSIIRVANIINTLTVASPGGQNVNGAASITLGATLYSSGIFMSDGSNWFKVGGV